MKIPYLRMTIRIRRLSIGILSLVILAACGEGQPPRPPSRDAAVPSPPNADASRPQPTSDASTDSAPPTPEEDAAPPPRIFARRFVANVHIEPRRNSARIGYLRAGGVTRATASEPAGREGCLAGWYPIEEGGYVCNRRDVTLFHGSRLPEVRSRQPNREEALPYEYARMFRQKAPLYRRLPTDEEAAIYEPRPTPRPAASRAADAGPAQAAPRSDAAAPAASGAAPETPPTTPAADPTATAASTATAAAPEPPPAAPPEAEDAGGPTLATLQGERDTVLQRWMLSGFYVSLDSIMSAGTRRYYRTQANGFLPLRSLRRVRGSNFSGLQIDGETWAFPIGYVMDRRAAWYERRDNGRVRRARGLPGFRHPFRIVGEETIRGRDYLVDPEGRLYLASDVRRIDSVERPEGIEEAQRWLDVDLSRQSLVAYEGDTPVFLTLISSGKRFRRGDEENFETPTGTFRISAKHVTDTMDGDSAIDGPYSIDDVPYVMYFRGAYAIHSAFWHNRFGRPKSHGCINASPQDAQWLFAWTTPNVPDSWHGAYPHDEALGTVVVIRGETPGRR